MWGNVSNEILHDIERVLAVLLIYRFNDYIPQYEASTSFASDINFKNDTKF